MKKCLFRALAHIIFITAFIVSQDALAVPYNPISLTDTLYLEFDPKINDNGHVVWAGEDGSDFEIFLFDGTNTLQITDNETPDMYPQVNISGHIVWEGHDGNDTEIYLYNGQDIIQLTDNSTNDRSPLINDNDIVVWEGNDGNDIEIYIFNGITVLQLTNNSKDDEAPHLNNMGHVVWMTEDVFDPVEFEYEYEIYLYNGTAIVQLTDNVFKDRNPQINSNGFVVWNGHDGSDWEIYFFDGTKITLITDNNYSDYDPQINDDNTIVWEGLVDNDSEIFMASPCIDADNDGFCNIDPDCDDINPAVNPEATEICYDGRDNDCNPDTVDDCPPVTVEISANQETIPAGQGTSLTWSSSNASTMFIDQGIGVVGLSGSYYVAPLDTTTYTITATGPSGTTTADVKITVTGRLQALENKLTAADAAAGDNFGLAVDISGNWAIAGAPYDDNTAANAGAAYVYKKEGASWDGGTKLLADDGASGDSFGGSVAISDDHVIVGAKYADYTPESSGAAYIFKYDGANWVQQIKIPAEDSGTQYLGESAAITPDFAICGGNGNVLIYKKEGNNWLEMARLSDPGAPFYSSFGQSVAVDGNTVMIGSDNAAYIYRYNGLAWEEEASLIGNPQNDFGRKVSISGDYAVVGDMFEDDPVYSSLGAAYIYHFNGSQWVHQARLMPGDPSDLIGFGSSVDINGDYLVVGAKGYGAESYWNRDGWSYVFKRNDSTWQEIGKILATDGGRDDYFGTSIAMSGANIIIGANGNQDDGYNSGSAYIYELFDIVIELEADPEITPSGDSTLTWHSFNADSCSIEPGIGTVALSGALPIAVSETTSYTVTCSNADESISVNTTVTIGHLLPAIIADISTNALQFGENATISWNTINADSVTIDHGIGTMPTNGSIAVTPSEATTVYTISAIGPGGEKSTTVSVSILPTIMISAEPTSIQIGETITLTLNIQFADSCTLEPDIGTVACNGDVTVTPAEISSINTYTVNATGPGGTASDTIDIEVTFPQPGIYFNAFMLNSYTYYLEWTTTYANDCTINHGIGTVPVTGTKQGYISQNDLFIITASGPGGTVTTAQPIFVETDPAPLITITSPQQGDIISRPDIMVEGYVFHSDDQEIGVTVNGVLALVDGNKFVANHVPLLDGQNIITAVATDFAGNTAQHGITVNAGTTTDYIKVVASKESGLSPFDFTLKINGTFNVIDPLLSYTGPGAVTTQPGSESNELDISLTEPGIYIFTVEEIYANTDTLEDSVAVSVMDKTDLDALLRAKWEGMKTALSVQDVEGGVTNISKNSKNNYREIFILLSTNLPQLISEMQDIEMIYAEDERAKYRINRLHHIDGNPVTITYYIYFSIDDTGLWKIEQF